MPGYFPQHTAMMRVEDPKVFRRFSLSLPEMALTTGVLLHVFRSVALTHGSNSIMWIVATWTIGLLLLVGMATAHLANFPLHHWLWRAPAFVGLEVLGEMLTSLLLIWLGREPNGTVRAHWSDWVGLSTRTLLVRGLIVVVWALVLAAIVQAVHNMRVVKEEADDPVEETP